MCVIKVGHERFNTDHIVRVLYKPERDEVVLNVVNDDFPMTIEGPGAHLFVTAYDALVGVYDVKKDFR